MSKRSRARFRNLKHKRDDIADAVMMAMWYVETQGTEIPEQVRLMDSDDELSDNIDIDIEESVEQEQVVETKEDADLIELNSVM